MLWQFSIELIDVSAYRRWSVMIGFILGRNAIVAYIHQRHQQPAAA